MYQMPSFNDQMEKLDRTYGVNANSIDKIVKDIDEKTCRDAFSEVLDINTIVGYAFYVYYYPQSALRNTAMDKALELTKAQNTIEAYADYLAVFPGYRSEEVKQMALNVAKKTNDLNSYSELVSSIPELQNDEVELLAFKAAVAENRYKTQAQFAAAFPKLCSDVTKTIALMSKEKLDSNGQSILKKLKIEYINSHTHDLASLDAAIKKYPIFNLRYSENFYTKETTFRALGDDLDIIVPYLNNDLREKILDEFVNKFLEFTESKGEKGIAGAKEIADAFPSFYNEITDPIYKEISKIKVSTKKYTRKDLEGNNEEQLAKIMAFTDELLNLSNGENLCEDFIKYFPTHKRIGEVKKKLKEITDRQNYISKWLEDEGKRLNK